MGVFEIVVIEEGSPGMSRVTYPGVPAGAADRTPGEETCQTIFHRPIIHVLPVNSNHFFSFKQTGIAHRLHKLRRLHRLPGLTSVIKIKEICVNLCNMWVNKIKQEEYHDKDFQVDHFSYFHIINGSITRIGDVENIENDCLVMEEALIAGKSHVQAAVKER